MALISPILDNRSYEQLRDELIRRIPVYAPEWTNHNESDPGIALVELFAYLGESLLYRFNQIPDAARIEFLRMLGVRPRPAQSALTLLAVSTERAEGVQILQGSEAAAGAVSFQTQDEVYAWPLDLVAAGKTPEDPADTKTGHDSSEDALARAKAKKATAQFYRTTVVSADPLAADAVSVDVSAQADRSLWIALLRKDTTDVEKLAGRTLFIGVAFDETIAEPVQLEALKADGAAAFRSDGLTSSPPPMLWRLWNGPPKTPAGSKGGAGGKGGNGSPGGAETPAFQELQVLGDTTKGLVSSGVVKLALPAGLPTVTAPSSGGQDSPPPLEDTKLAQNVIAWIQVCRPENADANDSIHRVRWVGINAVQAIASRTAAAELLGNGTGDGDQQLPLNHHPVVPGSMVLEVEEPAGWTSWLEVENFSGSGAGDRHYLVDYDHGSVSFGRARVPQIGERIRVLAYQYGGGSAGNVAAGAVSALPGTAGVKVANPLPAAGGADGVRIDEAMDAIPAEVHRHDRAVIGADFRDLALQVSGVQRAETLPLLHPDNPTVPAAGVVSVMVFPEFDLRNPAAPMPDLGLLRRVARYLDARRLVTTELYVIPPEYVRISVSVGVQVRAGYQVDAVRRWVELILRQYLAPLPPYGPDGGGWPLGRTIRRAELEAIAVQVEGVEYLEDLLLASPDAPRTEQPRIDLLPWQLPELAAITVVSGTPLPVGTEYAPAPAPKVPVPLPPEVC
ncbi:putative baseplate assembly protein [Paeniglutamicibacter antarcticus]|uniref:Baseplate assembly protein n=1 Tax=Arthrobacter terrae TaxID=2935737 RepID=A0A931G425_9MICC|nr:putative baseplate assembly protein [Arthrobacter terrae]MBG0737935.1 putative baseplate assembly protein [Arthrobacter terrae]